MHPVRLVLLSLVLGLATRTRAAAPPEDIVWETPYVQYRIAQEGVNLGFVDRASGTDYLRPGATSACAFVRAAGRDHPATAATLIDGRLRLRFEGAAMEALVRVESRPSYLRFTVESVTGGEAEALTFLHVPLTVNGRPDEPYGACAFSLNLQTRVDQLPALQTELRATAYGKFGLVGAKAALVAAPVNRMLPVLKEVLLEADEMPPCRVAGPWADENPFSHGSYLFNFGSLAETNVTDWIAMVRSLGFNQVDNHGGGAGFFRFGDFELNRRRWPEGWTSYRRIVDRLHAAGIGSIFHTYAFFLDKQSKYVTPVPDPRLDAFRTFTLARSLGVEGEEILVNEPTRGMSTITGFFEHNSVVLQLGDELVTFGGVSQETPWRFTGVKRGAFGTRAAAHAAETTARHLKECFGLFVPNPESSLFEEIAANHAAIVNQCGFDGIYLDAIDGSSILRGPDESWYWADKFVFAIQRRLERPVGMEMSAMWHHFWQYRTRWQAWDYPQRGQARFVDLHAQEIHSGLLLPLHLGWWNFQSFQPPQIEPTFPDVMTQVGARLIGWNAGLSLTGAVDRDRLREVPLFRRDVEILRTCEEMRQAGTVSENVRAQLREPGAEFALRTEADGKPRFRRARAVAQIVSPAEPWTATWAVTNPFPAQPLRFRLEALMSAGAEAETNATVLADAALRDTNMWTRTAADGVEASAIAAAAEAGPMVVLLQATNQGRVSPRAAWTRWERRFAPTLDLRNRQALSMEVAGDGSGALLAIRLESPHHLAFGAVADRYLPLDFTGRRMVTLVETESTRWSDYGWNDGKSLYNVYRENVDFGAVESVSVWLQNVPAHATTRCALGAIRAVPMIAATVRNPVLALNGVELRLPVELASGSWLEYDGAGECVHYGAKGETLGRVEVTVGAVALGAGVNVVRATAGPGEGPAARFKVTVFCQGEVL